MRNRDPKTQVGSCVARCVLEVEATLLFRMLFRMLLQLLRQPCSKPMTALPYSEYGSHCLPRGCWVSALSPISPSPKHCPINENNLSVPVPQCGLAKYCVCTCPHGEWIPAWFPSEKSSPLNFHILSAYENASFCKDKSGLREPLSSPACPRSIPPPDKLTPCSLHRIVGEICGE